MNPLLLSLGGKLIDKFIPDKEAQAKAKMGLIEAEQRGELAHLNAQMEIIVAEAKSADPWTSRARPTFMYVFYLILLSNCFVMPLIGIFYVESMTAYYTNLGTGLKALPTELWALFGTAFTGYTLSRSYDKGQIIKQKKTIKEALLDRFS